MRSLLVLFALVVSHSALAEQRPVAGRTIGVRLRVNDRTGEAWQQLRTHIEIDGKPFVDRAGPCPSQSPALNTVVASSELGEHTLVVELRYHRETERRDLESVIALRAVYRMAVHAGSPAEITLVLENRDGLLDLRWEHGASVFGERVAFTETLGVDRAEADESDLAKGLRFH